ncbi:MAG TPA: carbonic anhydrase [Saprospiraceae bacterium]|nr:carbonic anhydrase [Saprospiraceae bacterium]
MSISIKYPLWILLIGVWSCKPVPKPTISSAEAHISPEKALACLLAGNERYMNDHPIHPDQTLSRIRDLKKGQHPFAVVVSCSDSRVPPELIFDQGLGDIFVIRTAGNIIGEYELGSIEYAVEHLKAHLIVVLGHDSCGAVSAFVEHKHDKLDSHIQAIIDYIKAEPEEVEINEQRPNYLDLAVRANIRHGVNILVSSEPTLRGLFEKAEISIVGAIYHLENGKVEIIQ